MNPYSPAYEHPYRRGVVPTVAQSRKMKGFAATQAQTAASSSQTLSYGGGIQSVGVTSGTPRIYLVFWGSQWGQSSTDSNGNLNFTGDPDNGAPYIQQLFKGLGTGGEQWSGTMTQYCDGSVVVTGATSCVGGSLHVGYPTGGPLAGVWYDSSAAEPAAASGNQIGQEAVSAAAHFANTTAASNRYVQYDILSAPGLDPDGYQNPVTGFCAWHDFTGDSTLDGGGAVNSPYGNLAFTNMPYVMDAGSYCGQNFVNQSTMGTLDGYSIVNGHEYAETITDQFPAGGWTNNNSNSSFFGEENADECAWLSPKTTGGAANVAMATGSFAMQSTWSNDTNSCAISHQVVQDSDFSLSANPATVAVPAGSSITTSVTPAVTVSPAETVNLSVPNLPAGLTASFRPPSVTSGGSSTLTLQTATTFPPGPVTVTVLGTAPTGSHSATLSLTVDNPPASVTPVSGGGQAATVGTSYAHPLEVHAVDSGGQPVIGAQVTFAAPSSGATATFTGCSTTCTAVTDAQGDATSPPVRAGSIAGQVTVTTSVAGLSPAFAPPSFALTNLPGAPSTLTGVSGDGQSAPVGTTFADPLKVGMSDSFGNPVPGVAVTFSAPAFGPTVAFGACSGGNPSAHECVANTGTDGVATSGPLTAGSTPGSVLIRATGAGLPAASFVLSDAQSGYWTVAADGGVFSFGGAPYYGSTGGVHLNAPIVAMTRSHQGGYYLVASDGGIFTFGPGATYYGSTGAIHLNAPIVGMATTPQGGYYLVASDGGIFTFGPGATYYGSTGAIHLTKPIVGISIDPATGGYWLDATDGGIFAFNAPFYGSTGNVALVAPMVAMAPSA